MTRPTGGPPAAPYDRISVAYDLIADPAEHQARDRGLDLLSARPGERVLEIGGGTGRALIELAQAVGPSGEVCGLDPSAGMLRLARQRLSSCPGHVDLQQGDGRFLPYLAASFDAAFMSFTLELFDPLDIELLLSEIKRVLRPRGGRLAIVCLTPMPEPGLVAQAYEWLHRRFPHLIDCRPIDVLRHLERSGYGVTSTESMTLWSLPVTAVLGQPIASPHKQGDGTDASHA
jgi:ubiquinone/menaquinone biosynthesis C-methylase UbiE